MSHKRLYRALLPSLVGCFALLAVGAATGATPAKAPKKATVRAEGKVEFKPGKYYREGYHFRAARVTIASGGTLTLVDRTGADHTFSLLKANQIPKTLKKVDACYADQGPCSGILAAHGSGPNGGPGNPVVNVGSGGLDQAGDSVVLPPRTKNTKIKVTAKPGTTLNFMCVLHPQMQGQLIVKK